MQRRKENLVSRDLGMFNFSQASQKIILKHLSHISQKTIKNCLFGTTCMLQSDVSSSSTEVIYLQEVLEILKRTLHQFLKNFKCFQNIVES